jgi:exopolyphosphatase/guanosine-5'-triphosphate,3'-diphosphate pyrophosphatase
MSDTSAVISIGTNSTRMLLVDFSAKRFGLFGDHATRIIKQRSTGTRIGEGLRESGQLDEAAMRRTLEVVQSYMNELRGKTERLHVIATSAVRRAQNADDFSRQIDDITNCDLNILDGKDEAAASFRGAVTSLDDVEDQCVGVIDAGGGSTEYAVGEHEHAEKSLSCEIGAVRLTDWFPSLAGHEGMVDNETIDGARAKARELLERITSLPSVIAVAVVGGSATTALSVVRGHHARFGDQTLRRDKLRDAFNMLCEMPCEKRKTVPGMNPQRADILPAGMLILDTALELLGFEEATVSYTDLLFGYLLLEREGSLYLT